MGLLSGGAFVHAPYYLAGVRYKIRNPIESVPMGPYFVMEFGPLIEF